MDNKNEDTMVRQIEKNLSNDINENLFVTGRVAEGTRVAARGNEMYQLADNVITANEVNPKYPLVSNDYISPSGSLSRAEYIRQAREACLRQLSAVQIYSRPYDSNYMEPEPETNEQLNQKKAKVMKLFHNDSDESDKTQPNSSQIMNGYRFVIIRFVCAVAVFLSIFLIDKFDVKLGNITNKTIKEYVMGNDALEDIENIIVTWLK